ncbi:uncharacterized protein LOC113476855 isoform X2 [Athene cunicularia]|uniref:uncharacterized protein LOC113476855 isoform X2 n=1 Tax=Athene cunicularia TaxID=194338 RepID=UPI000EF7163E|nr:uncharacterized protein LOC113476855 isoform X2 [Athene cunicularia]
MPIPFPSHPASSASPCPATKGCLPSQRTNQAFKFNSCPQPRRFKVIRRLIKAHVLLCWLGGEFLHRARKISSGDQCGTRRMLFAIAPALPMSDKVLTGSLPPRVTPCPLHPDAPTHTNHAPPLVLRQSQSGRRARGLRTSRHPGGETEAQRGMLSPEPDAAPGLVASWSEMGNGGCVFMRWVGYVWLDLQVPSERIPVRSGEFPEEWRASRRVESFQSPSCSHTLTGWTRSLVVPSHLISPYIQLHRLPPRATGDLHAGRGMAKKTKPQWCWSAACSTLHDPRDHLPAPTTTPHFLISSSELRINYLASPRKHRECLKHAELQL